MSYNDWENDPPTSKQITAMDTIVYYLPDLEDERKKCLTKGKASNFIGKYKEESYKARDDHFRSCKYDLMIDANGDVYYDEDWYYDSEEW